MNCRICQKTGEKLAMQWKTTSAICRLGINDSG